MAVSGKRAVSRHTGPSQAGGGRLRLFALSAATTVCVVAWGFLVWAAIDFGRTARGGDDAGWGFLAVASVGAMACLFVALLLVVRVLRLVGVLSTALASPTATPGGRRARR